MEATLAVLHDRWSSGGLQPSNLGFDLFNDSVNETRRQLPRIREQRRRELCGLSPYHGAGCS
jgi:hypothetical protein